jgi:hypothetical protein
MAKDFMTKFISQYFKDRQNMRIGQMFVNRYISEPWPELYYEESNYKAIEMISKWLTENNYFYQEPPRVHKSH